MKRIIFLCFIVLGTSIFVYGQSEEVKVEKSLLGVYFIPLKLSYEQGIGKSNTVELSGGLDGVSWFENDEFKFGLAPFAEGYFKSYYNLEKRHRNGRRTEMNSGNYWGLMARYNFPAISGDDSEERFRSFFVAPVWGFQRNYSSHFSLGMDLGFGVGFNQDNAYFSPVVRLKLGFVLFSHAGK
jgi:hypothetical protein